MSFSNNIIPAKPTTKKIKKTYINISHMYRHHIVIINYKPEYCHTIVNSYAGIYFCVIIIKKCG